MRTPRTLPALVVLLVIAGACGGGAATTPPAGTAGPSPGGAPTVTPVIVSSELGVGENRAVFALVDSATNRPVASRDRELAVGFEGPAGETVDPRAARFIWAIEDEVAVWSLDVSFPAAGAWTAEFITSAPEAPTERVRVGFDVREDTRVLRPGETVPSVDTPTADDVGGDLGRLSTDAEPVPSFYEVSVADALAAGEPFVVAFATPKFCATAQCGPTLDRLKPVAAAHPEITFINVEPYQLEVVDGQLQPVLDQNGQLQAVPAVEAFGLLSEPYVFVVDGQGVVRAGYEAVFAEEEIEAALAALG